MAPTRVVHDWAKNKSKAGKRGTFLGGSAFLFKTAGRRFVRRAIQLANTNAIHSPYYPTEQFIPSRATHSILSEVR